MKAKIKELWFVVECPKCHRPMAKNRYITNNSVAITPMTVSCDLCESAFVIDLNVFTDEGALYGYIQGHPAMDEDEVVPRD